MNEPEIRKAGHGVPGTVLHSPTCKRPWCQTPDRHKKDGGCIAFWL